jgi:hypothetical protein
MNNDSPDPTFQSTLVPELVDLCEYFYETFLQHILCIFTVAGKPIAYTQHPWAEAIVKRFLCGRYIMQTAMKHYLFCHMYCAWLPY